MIPKIQLTAAFISVLLFAWTTTKGYPKNPLSSFLLQIVQWGFLLILIVTTLIRIWI